MAQWLKGRGVCLHRFDLFSYFILKNFSLSLILPLDKKKTLTCFKIVFQQKKKNLLQHILLWKNIGKLAFYIRQLDLRLQILKQ